MRLHRVTAADWPLVREIRLRGLLDPNANLAFLTTHAQDAAQPDEFWQRRAADAAVGGPNAQFVTLDEDDVWQGSATVIRQRTPAVRTGSRFMVVGVFVDPVARGTGAIDDLLDACAAHASRNGHERLYLDVHVDNARARAAYVRAGFAPTGVEFDSAIGHEMEMARAV